MYIYLNKKIKGIKKKFNIFKKFEKNFNERYSWFFTNGMKSQHINILSMSSKMDIMSIALANAYQMSLEVEVVTCALKHMKENPNLTVDEAITMGYSEWVK